MDTPSTRDMLLDRAYEIADKYGLAALSIRGLASECGVSVGSIYKQFSSKGELTTATAELYFKRAFFDDFCHPTKGERYLDFCVRMYDSMNEVLAHYRVYWLKDSEALPASEKSAARYREEEQFAHIRRGLVFVFMNDAAIRTDLPACVTPEAVCEFTLRNVLDALRSKESDCSLLFTMLEHTLYE